MSQLICHTNTMLSRFNFCSSEIKSRLFRTYCISFYGCPLWDLRSNYIKYFYRTWRKCIRRVWNLPYRCHNKFTYIIYDNLPIDVQLMLRFINFYLGVLTSKNSIVSLCSQLCSHSNTAVAKNKRKLLHYLNDNGDILDVFSRPSLYCPVCCGGHRSPAVACWAADHWVASLNPLRGKFRH